MAFSALEVAPGVVHIQDSMGVCMTLVTGTRRALLVDGGYGLEDVAAQVRSRTELPLEVLLTHGHHDHALGAQWFDRVKLFREDAPCYGTYTGAQTRQSVLAQARGKGLEPAPGWLEAPMPAPEPLEEGEISLGGCAAQVLRCPGHTPGSAVVYLPERELLLTGDDWNPCTWLFFPEAESVWTLRRTLEGLLALPFRQVLCPHQAAPQPRALLEAFVAGLTEENIASARPVTMGGWEAIDTRQAEPAPGQVLVFDAEKAGLPGKRRNSD